MQPGELAPGRIGLDVTLKVHVVAVFDVVRGERGAEPQRHYRRICGWEGERKGRRLVRVCEDSQTDYHITESNLNVTLLSLE